MIFSSENSSVPFVRSLDFNSFLFRLKICFLTLIDPWCWKKSQSPLTLSVFEFWVWKSRQQCTIASSTIFFPRPVKMLQFTSKEKWYKKMSESPGGASTSRIHSKMSPEKHSQSWVSLERGRNSLGNSQSLLLNSPHTPSIHCQDLTYFIFKPPLA